MMKLNTVALATISLITYLIFAPLALAQEGHPMSGVWVGDWGQNAEQRNRVVIVLEWAGTELTGTINPGPNAIPIKSTSVTMMSPSDWGLHIEADGRNSRGQRATFMIDGTIDDIGTYNRSLAGTWNVGNEQGNFSITRQ
jgi:hypothetical protein